LVLLQLLRHAVNISEHAGTELIQLATMRQRAVCITHPGILLLIEGQTKGDVIAQAEVLAPGVLGHHGNTATTLSSTLHRLHVSKDGVHQGGLAGTDTPNNTDDLSRLAAELGHVEGEVLLAVVLELGVALQGRTGRSRNSTSQNTLGQLTVCRRGAASVEGWLRHWRADNSYCRAWHNSSQL
jgi:hypothetical protein